MNIIKQWGVYVTEKFGYEDDSRWTRYLTGITNSKSIMEIIECVRQEPGYKVVVAGGKEYKVLKSEVDPKYIEAFKDAYAKLGSETL